MCATSNEQVFAVFVSVTASQGWPHFVDHIYPLNQFSTIIITSNVNMYGLYILMRSAFVHVNLMFFSGSQQ